jgi:hypothetical protein
VAAGNEIVVSQAGVVNKATMTQVESFIFSAKTQVTPNNGDIVVVRRGSDIRQMPVENMLPTGSVTNAMLGGSIADTKLNTISTAGKVANSATTATAGFSGSNYNTAANNAIVARDGSGNFAAGTITASLSGNASTATTADNVVDGAITNAKVASNAAIAGTKISPNFGSQNIETTGTGLFTRPSNHWATSGYFGVGTSNARLGQLDTHAAFEVTLTSNGYRDNTAGTNLWVSHAANSQTGAAQIALNPEGSLIFRTDSSKATGSPFSITERMRITSGGLVGIATSTPATTLDVNGDVTITDKIIHSGDTNTAIRFPANDTVTIETGGTERLRIDTAINTHHAVRLFTASDNEFSNTTSLNKSRGSSTSPTIVQNGDQCGILSFRGYDGSDFRSASAISGYVDGAPGANDMPGRLLFFTTADGSTSLTERMRITSGGLIGINTSNPATTLDVNGDVTISDKIIHSGDTNTAIRFPANDTVTVETSGTEWFRVDPNGKVYMRSSTDYSPSGTSFRLQVHQVNSATEGLAAFNWSSAGAALGGRISLLRSASTTQGAYTACSSAAQYGQIDFWGSDGSKFVQAASIIAYPDATPGADDMPCRLIFSTTADGGNTPTERMRIDSSGNVGINTASPASRFHVEGDVTITDKIIHSGDTDTAIRFPANDTMTVETGGSERLRITSSGEVLIGGTSNPQIGNLQGLLLSQRAGSVGFGAVRYTNNTTPPIIALGKSRGGSVGANAILQNNDSLGWIEFAGDDGVDLQSIGASIVAAVDGTPGANDMPGRLVFSTTADGSAAPTERMRIGANGRVGIGTTSPSEALEVNGNIKATSFVGTASAIADGSVTDSKINGTLSGSKITPNFTSAISINGVQIVTTRPSKAFGKPTGETFNLNVTGSSATFPRDTATLDTTRLYLAAVIDVLRHHGLVNG